MESRFREAASSSSPTSTSQIVHLNVGGVHFTTSRQTLVNGTAVGQAAGAGAGAADTFFTALLSGRIASEKDEQGALFIDRKAEIVNLKCVHAICFIRDKVICQLVCPLENKQN